MITHRLIMINSLYTLPLPCQNNKMDAQLPLVTITNTARPATNDHTTVENSNRLEQGHFQKLRTTALLVVVAPFGSSLLSGIVKLVHSFPSLISATMSKYIRQTLFHYWAVPYRRRQIDIHSTNNSNSTPFNYHDCQRR